ncbi:MAG: hypothetical protein KBT11_08735 [Treponema sp.]|nr:hypothetical protein [Candidatus Treponema equifaecale]
MTRLLKISFVLLCLLLFFSSCSDAVIGEVTDSSDSIQNSDFILNGYIENVQKISSSRQILPSSPSESLDYYLYGKSEEKKLTVGIQKIAVLEDGKFSIKLAPDCWDLIVFAVESGKTATNTPSEIPKTALYMSRATIDMRNGAQTVTFTLDSERLTGNGTIDFTFMLSNDSGTTFWTIPAGCTLNAEIQNPITGETVTYAESANKAIKRNVLVGYGAASFGNSEKLPQGTYNFVVSIYDSSNNLKSYWSDILIVQSQRTNSQTVYVPQMVDSLPAAPEYFTAAYISNSEDNANHDGSYKVLFSWANTPVNETHYEIQLADITDVSLSSEKLTDALWNSIGSSRQITIDKTLPMKNFWADGSVLANNTNATVWLKLGYQYAARIRSVNAFGTSEWTDLTLTNGTTTATGNVATDKISDYAVLPLEYFVSPSGATCSLISRARVKYNFMGGFYRNSSTSTSRIHSPLYFCQTGYNSFTVEAIQLWDAKGYDSSADTDDLQKIANDKIYTFKSWSKSLNFALTDRLTTYSGYKNLDVYAEYDETSDPATPETAYKFPASWIRYTTDGDSTEKAVSTSPTDFRASLILSKASISNGSTSNINFSVKVPAGEIPEQFKNITLSVTDGSDNIIIPSTSAVVAPIGASSYFNGINVETWNEGTYCFEFIAEPNGSNSANAYKVYLYVTLTP